MHGEKIGMAAGRPPAPRPPGRTGYASRPATETGTASRPEAETASRDGVTRVYAPPGEGAPDTVKSDRDSGVDEQAHGRHRRAPEKQATYREVFAIREFRGVWFA